MLLQGIPVSSSSKITWVFTGSLLFRKMVCSRTSIQMSLYDKIQKNSIVQIHKNGEFLPIKNGHYSENVENELAKSRLSRYTVHEIKKHS